MREQGLPEDVIELRKHLFADVLDGRNAHLADGVHRVLGRPPWDLVDSVHDAAGAWA